MPRGVDSTSPELAYVSKPNIVYPGTQAQADEVEVQARANAANQGRLFSLEFPTANIPPGAVSSSGTTVTIETNGLRGVV